MSPDPVTAIERSAQPAGSRRNAVSSPDDIDLCAARATDRLRALQRVDGSFEGEVVWCPMILAQYVILRAFLRRPRPLA